MPDENVIRAQDLIELFHQALDNKWGYIWGTAGEKWTAAKQAAIEKTTDDDRALSRKYGSKWIGHTVADCSGLFSWAFKQLGGYMYHGSDTMYKKYCVNKGELKKGQRTDGGTLRPGTAVFVWNGKKYSHVGLFVGGSTVIEAMGTINGVATTLVSASKWTHWGELKGMTFDGSVPTPEPVPATKPTLRRGSKGEWVTKLQVMLVNRGYELPKYGADGQFGNETEAAVIRFQADHGLISDGVVGAKTWDALEQTADKAVTYTVTVTGLTASKADEIISKYGGSKAAEK